MKNLFYLFFAILLAVPCFGQEEAAEGSAGGSLIADIMNVNPVAVVMSEDVEKANNDYQKDFEEEKNKLDKAIAKEAESYTKEVKEHISKFAKVLEKAIVNDVNNEKKVVGSKVNAATFATRKNKKALVTTFNNKMSVEIRKLHDSLKDDRKKELAEAVEEYLKTFEDEFEANQAVIKQFKTTEHLTQQESAPAADSSEN